MFFFLACTLSPAALGDDWSYAVRPGDTIWGLCSDYVAKEDCPHNLVDYNRIAEPRSLQPGTVLKIPFTWLKQVPVAAEVVHVLGDVKAYGGEKAAVTPGLSGKVTEGELASGQKVFVGTRITVGDGYLTLRFADGSILSMYPGSEITLDAVSAFKQTRPQSVSASLPRGRVKVVVPSRNPKTRFRIKTPAAVAAVRGTSFRLDSQVKSGEPVMRSEVLEGTVSVGDKNNAQDISEGFGLLSQKGFTTQAVQLLQAPAWNYQCTDPGYVEWEAIDGAENYQLMLKEDDVALDRVVASLEVRGNSHTFSGLEEKCYQVSVSAADSEGFNGFEGQRRLCYAEVPASPGIESAVRKRNELDIRWAPVDGVDHYVVDTSRRENFQTIIFSEKVTEARISKGIPEVDGDIYARIYAVSPEGQRSLPGDVVVLEEDSDNRVLVGVLSLLLVFAFL